MSLSAYGLHSAMTSPPDHHHDTPEPQQPQPMTEAILKRADPAEIQEAIIRFLSACSLTQYVEQILAAVREFLQPGTIVYQHEVVRQLWKMVDEGKIIFRSGFLIPRVPTDPPQPQPMTEQHPITPPQELVGQWCIEWNNDTCLARSPYLYVADQAARWGADQELEACKRIAYDRGQPDTAAALQRIRRPKPPSLKEQALSELAAAVAAGDITPERGATIRRALESLPEGAQ